MAIERDARTGLVIEDERVNERLKEMFAKAIDIGKLPYLMRRLERFTEERSESTHKPMRTRLFMDSSPLSLFFSYETYDYQANEWQRIYNGGIIWHEASQEWGVHT